jgi:hypothetical protein
MFFSLKNPKISFPKKAEHDRDTNIFEFLLFGSQQTRKTRSDTTRVRQPQRILGVKRTDTQSPPMQVAHCAAIAPTRPVDELSDELRWDFLRKLVEEEFAKVQGEPKQAAQAHGKPGYAASNESLSGMSTAYSSPVARPVQGPKASSVLPVVSPAFGPVAEKGSDATVPAMSGAAQYASFKPVLLPKQCGPETGCDATSAPLMHGVVSQTTSSSVLKPKQGSPRKAQGIPSSPLVLPLCGPATQIPGFEATSVPFVPVRRVPQVVPAFQPVQSSQTRFSIFAQVPVCDPFHGHDGVPPGSFSC